MLNKVAGFNFHNKSKLDFEKMKADPDNIAANLRNYINGFSVAGREKIEYFSFNDQIAKYRPLRSLEEIRTDLLELELETQGLMSEVVEI